MAINKVVYGDQTLVDLTQDSVEASNLLEGETAHDRSGNPVTGTAKQGHIIQDADGNNVTQRNTVQFADAFLTDDSVNGRTVVENIKEVLPADYDSTTDEGIIVCDDGNDVPIGEIEEDSVTVTSTGSDNKNWGDLLLELRNEMDISKVTEFSYLILNDSLIYPLYRLSDLTFTWISLAGGGQYDIESIRLSSSPNIVENYNGTITNRTNTLITNSQKLTLHYGNKKAVVDLQTTANRCLMQSGANVQETLRNMRYYDVSIGNGSSITLNIDQTDRFTIYLNHSSNTNRTYIGFGCGGSNAHIEDIIANASITKTAGSKTITLTNNTGGSLSGWVEIQQTGAFSIT